MVPALLLLIAEPNLIKLQERVPLVLVVSTPTGQVADISKSELIRIIGDQAKRYTDFFPQELDELVVEECKGRLTCLALKSRRDYDREAWVRGGKVRPFEDFLDHTRDGPIQPRYLLLISNLSIPDGADRLTLTLLDVERALRIHHEAVRKPGWADDVEATVSEEALAAPPIKSEVRDAQEATTFLATAFTHELADELEASGHWEPYGELEIECEIDGAVIRLDGNGLGSTIAGVTKLVGARPGTRTLELEHADYLLYQTTVEVVRGGTAHLKAELVTRPSNVAGTVRKAVLWTGVAVGAAGIAIAIAGAALQGDAETSCFAPCDTGSEFQTFGYDDAKVGTSARINPSGVAVAPLGYALAGTGLIWSVGTWLFGADGDIPWIQLAAGVVAGSTAYALSVVLDGSAPEAQ